MHSPEILVLIMVGGLIAVAYTLIYPRVAGSDGTLMAKLDILLSAIAVFLVWLAYGTDGQRFKIFGFEMNWFIFTIGAYFVIEVPVALWYYTKHNIWASFKRDEK